MRLPRRPGSLGVGNECLPIFRKIAHLAITGDLLLPVILVAAHLVDVAFPPVPPGILEKLESRRANTPQQRSLLPASTVELKKKERNCKMSECLKCLPDFRGDARERVHRVDLGCEPPVFVSVFVCALGRACAILARFCSCALARFCSCMRRSRLRECSGRHISHYILVMAY